MDQILPRFFSQSQLLRFSAHRRAMLSISIVRTNIPKCSQDAYIERGTAALAEKREQIIKASKRKTATIKFRSGKTAKFTPKPFNDEQLRHMMTRRSFWIEHRA